MPSKPIVRGFFDSATSTVSYMVHDPTTRAAAIIDSVLDFTARNARTSTGSADALLDYIEAGSLDLKWILDTHAHADHLSAAHYLREKTGVPVVIGSDITVIQKAFGALFEADDVTPDGSQFDRLVSEGESLPLGELEIGVMHTPGHTPACLTYLIGNAAFVGDTLFMPDYGTARCDFPGGDAATLHASIQKILALPPEARIFVGHDYLPTGRADYACVTSVAAQKAGNIHVHDGVDARSFVAMRQARDATLAPPTLILPSLQVNIAAGELPPPDAQGRRFLRLPLSLAG
jgi:glyoxylase-like metal-dependent hydrolase (beta-lactamase superfamily II)